MNSAHMAIVDDASAAMVSGIVTQEKLIGSHIDFGPLFLKVRELALFAPWRLRCQVSDQAITRPSKSPLPDPLSCTDGKLAAVLLDCRESDALYKKTNVQAILKSVCPEHAANQRDPLQFGNWLAHHQRTSHGKGRPTTARHDTKTNMLVPRP